MPAIMTGKVSNSRCLFAPSLSFPNFMCNMSCWYLIIGLLWCGGGGFDRWVELING